MRKLMNNQIKGCVDKCESACPFAYTEMSDIAQNYGCLPSAYEIINMMVYYGKTWACHMEPSIPCVGAIRYLKEENLPYTVIDTDLLTEQSDWHLYVEKI